VRPQEGKWVMQEYQPQNAWKQYTSSDAVRRREALAQECIDFFSCCKTERETVRWLCSQAALHGFSQGITDSSACIAFRDKAIILARRGWRSLTEGMRLIAAHGDTPHLDLKQRPLVEEAGIAQFKTHYYGGIKKYQWLARPLALHGVVVTRDLHVHPVVVGESPGDPVFTILDLLPHLAKAQLDQTVDKAFVAEKLNLVVGHAVEQDPSVRQAVLALLEAQYGFTEEDLVSAELQAVPAGPARWVGLDRSLLGAYGQDDRLCVFAAATAFFAATDPEFTQVLVVWDREEVGSEGASSAKSRFLRYTVEDLIDAWAPGIRLGQVMLSTLAVSADVHCPLDPDYQDVHDKHNAALLGHGPVFSKYTGHRGKYGSSEADAEYLAWFRTILGDIPWQIAAMGKVDEGGGGTVAKDLASWGMRVVDFGPGVLSMHSPFEISSVVDLQATVDAYLAFYCSGAFPCR